MADLKHLWSGDLEISSTGNLALSFGAERSRERVIRRINMNKGDDINHMESGVGLPKKIGEVQRLNIIKADILADLRLESSVKQSPPPKVEVSGDTKGLVNISIVYEDTIEGSTSLISDSYTR